MTTPQNDKLKSIIEEFEKEFIEKPPLFVKLEDMQAKALKAFIKSKLTEYGDFEREAGQKEQFQQDKKYGREYVRKSYIAGREDGLGMFVALSEQGMPHSRAEFDEFLVQAHAAGREEAIKEVVEILDGAKWGGFAEDKGGKWSKMHDEEIDLAIELVLSLQKAPQSKETKK